MANLEGDVFIGRITPFWENHRTLKGYLEKQCNVCNEWFKCSLDFFYKNKSNKSDGLSPTCRKCESNRATSWRKNNRPRWLENKRKVNQRPDVKMKKRESSKKQREQGKQKEWQQNNPEKVRQLAKNHRNHDITKSEWNACLNIFNYQCCYCGISEEEAKSKYKNKLHKDHKDYDGYNDVRNAIPACRSCNDKKWQFNFDDWYNNENPNFSQERYDKIIWWTNEGYKQFIESKPPYRISRERIYNEDGTWYYTHTLWTVDEKRNMLECIAVGEKKKDIDEYIKENKKV